MPVVMIDTSKTLWVGEFDSVQSIFTNFCESRYDYEAKKNIFNKDEGESIKEDLYGSRLHIAEYTSEDYDGSAYVLYEKDGEFYENSAWHCSCSGLEGQWAPSRVSLRELVDHRKYMSHEAQDKIFDIAKERSDGSFSAPYQGGDQS